MTIEEAADGIRALVYNLNNELLNLHHQVGMRRLDDILRTFAEGVRAEQDRALLECIESWEGTIAKLELDKVRLEAELERVRAAEIDAKLAELDAFLREGTPMRFKDIVALTLLDKIRLISLSPAKEER